MHLSHQVAIDRQSQLLLQDAQPSGATRQHPDNDHHQVTCDRTVAQAAPARPPPLRTTSSQSPPMLSTHCVATATRGVTASCWASSVACAPSSVYLCCALTTGQLGSTLTACQEAATALLAGPASAGPPAL